MLERSSFIRIDSNLAGRVQIPAYLHRDRIESVRFSEQNPAFLMVRMASGQEYPVQFDSSDDAKSWGLALMHDERFDLGVVDRVREYLNDMGRVPCVEDHPPSFDQRLCNCPSCRARRLVLAF